MAKGEPNVCTHHREEQLGKKEETVVFHSAEPTEIEPILSSDEKKADENDHQRDFKCIYDACETSLTFLL